VEWGRAAVSVAAWAVSARSLGEGRKSISLARLGSRKRFLFVSAAIWAGEEGVRFWRVVRVARAVCAVWVRELERAVAARVLVEGSGMGGGGGDLGRL